MIQFGLTETKLFHFHRLFKTGGGGGGLKQIPSGSATDVGVSLLCGRIFVNPNQHQPCDCCRRFGDPQYLVQVDITFVDWQILMLTEK